MSRYGGGGDSRYGGGSHYGGGNDHYGGGGGHRGGQQQNGGGGGGGAEHLARIHGTEEDRVNCPFYFKIGACRHGDRCSRVHNKPVFSQTIIVPHMYQNPLSQIIAQNGDPSQLDMAKVDEEFEDFYEEVFEELCSFGHLEELNICDNLGDHLVGNVYVKYEDEEDAAKAQQTLAGRFYAGRPLHCEFSPVTDFREARCRQFDEGTCNRGGYCNFMHIKTVQRSLQRELERKFNTSRKGGSRSRSRSRSPRSRSRSRSPRKSSRHRSSHRSSRRDRSRSRDKDHRSSRRSRRHERPEGSSSSRKSDGEQRGSYDQPRHDNGDSQPAAPAPPSNN